MTYIKRSTFIPWWAWLFLWARPWMITRSDTMFGEGMEVKSKRLFGMTYILSIKRIGD